MGCCFSTRNVEPRKNQSPKPSHSPEKLHGRRSEICDRGPPPVEEEIISVKEVLSETPISKPLSNSEAVQKTEAKVEPKHLQVEKEEEEDESLVEARSVISRAEDVSEVSQFSISQVSDLNSVTESLDTGTAFSEEVTSRDGGRMRRRATAPPSRVVKKRAFPGEIAGEKERRVRSPVVRRPAPPSPEKRNRGAVPSPEKRNRTALPSPDKRSRTALPSPEKRNRTALPSPEKRKTAARQRSASPGGFRRDAGGRSGASRRSRSPATRVDTAASRGVPKAKLATAEKSDEPSSEATEVAAGEEEKRESDVKVEKGEGERGDSPVTNESLENPHVSLECFIFL